MKKRLMIKTLFLTMFLLIMFGAYATCNAVRFNVLRQAIDSYGSWYTILAANPEYDWSDNYSAVYNNFCNDAKKLYLANWTLPAYSHLGEYAMSYLPTFYNIDTGCIVNNYNIEKEGGFGGLGSSIIEGSALGGNNAGSSSIVGYSLGAGGYNEPGVGYARWLISQLGLDYEMESSVDSDAHKSIQLLTWISALWGDFYDEERNYSAVVNPMWTYGYLDNYDIARRGKEYAEFWYGIYSKLRDPEQPFKCLSTEDDIHVYVDQTKGEITVGPYFLKLDTTGETFIEDERIFYNELSKKT